MRIRIAPGWAALAFVCAGCASVMEGSTQPIYVATTPVSGATCTCSNSRGQWSLVTPGSVIVKKSESVLTIRCSKPGWQDGSFYAAGRISNVGLAGMMIPYLGLVNTTVDASTGAAVRYPESFTIELKPLAPASAPAAPANATASPSVVPASAPAAPPTAPAGQPAAPATGNASQPAPQQTP
jgi:hypothetical protein